LDRLLPDGLGLLRAASRNFSRIVGKTFCSSPQRRCCWLSRPSRDADREIAKERSRDDLITKYIELISKLLIDQGLRDSKYGCEAREVARTHTLTVLDQLGPSQKPNLLRFLYRSQLIQRHWELRGLWAGDVAAAPIKLFRSPQFSKIDFDVAVGKTIAQNVSVVSLPPPVEDKYQDWRGFAWIHGDDDCFVDGAGHGQAIVVEPRTRTIVGVLRRVKVAGTISLAYADLSNVDFAAYREAIEPGDTSGEWSGLDLSCANLKGAKFDGLLLEGVDFGLADLSAASLKNAIIDTCPDLWSNAKLNNTDFRKAGTVEHVLYDSAPNDIQNVLVKAGVSGTAILPDGSEAVFGLAQGGLGASAAQGVRERTMSQGSQMGDRGIVTAWLHRNIDIVNGGANIVLALGVSIAALTYWGAERNARLQETLSLLGLGSHRTEEEGSKHDHLMFQYCPARFDVPIKTPLSEETARSFLNVATNPNDKLFEQYDVARKELNDLTPFAFSYVHGLGDGKIMADAGCLALIRGYKYFERLIYVFGVKYGRGQAWQDIKDAVVKMKAEHPESCSGEPLTISAVTGAK
jgi:hypothetical protein